MKLGSCCDTQLVQRESSKSSFGLDSIVLLLVVSSIPMLSSYTISLDIHACTNNIIMYSNAYIYITTPLNSHHGAAVTSRVAGATKISSHITTLKSRHGRHFLIEFIAGANESSKSCLHIFSIRIKKSLRARSTYAIFNCASIIAIYIGRWF